MRYIKEDWAEIHSWMSSLCRSSYSCRHLHLKWLKTFLKLIDRKCKTQTNCLLWVYRVIQRSPKIWHRYENLGFKDLKFLTSLYHKMNPSSVKNGNTAEINTWKFWSEFKYFIILTLKFPGKSKLVYYNVQNDWPSKMNTATIE